MTDLRELQRLEPLFWRAPSAHNTQPWVLDYGPDRIGLGFDPARHLDAGDPTQRDLELALGAFVETVLIAAAAEGVGLAFDGDAFVPGPVYESPFGPDDLRRRQTSRLPYESRLTDSELAAARAELRDGERLDELPAQELTRLFLVVDRHVYESPAIVAELRRWLRLSKSDPDYERDGLTYEALALSPLEARLLGFALRPAPLRAVCALRLHHAFASSSASVLRSGSVLVLSSSRGCAGERPDTVARLARALRARVLYASAESADRFRADRARACAAAPHRRAATRAERLSRRTLAGTGSLRAPAELSQAVSVASRARRATPSCSAAAATAAATAGTTSRLKTLGTM